MAGNSWGRLLRITSFGESHGPVVGGVLDGFPAGFTLDMEAVQREVARRRPGQSEVTTARQETDSVEFLSGILDGKTLGSPIAFILRNSDARSDDYDPFQDVYRPSHADYTYQTKYGIRDHRGGGRSSARETAVRVVAGAIARQLLARYGVRISAYVTAIGGIEATPMTDFVASDAVDANIVRCPDATTAAKMIERIKELKGAGDSCGGVIQGVVAGVLPALGEPVYDKLSARLAEAMVGINAVHGFEFGSGFAGTSQTGIEHNDPFIAGANGQVTTRTNNSGGIQGGISNGMDILFKVAFKPASTLSQQQDTVNSRGEAVTLEAKGRHDPCVVPRAVPIVEAMTALTLADFLLLNLSSQVAHLDSVYHPSST